MRRAEASGRRTAADDSSTWVRILIVMVSKELRFPSFWQLQILGWSCFYVLVLVASAPYLKEPGTFRDTNWFVATLFLASCLLRPICRSLVRRSLPWITLEAWAFLWSLMVGATAAFFPDPAIMGLKSVDWALWVVNSVQSSVVLILWCNLYFSIKLWRQSAEERERLLRAEAEAREARLSALRYQLNPHFLFNSLNAVSTLVLDGNAQAATRMLSQIGELLRTTLDREVVPEVPLSEEIALAQQYLAIEQTRLGERLTVDLIIAPDTLDARIPNMLLQPLVENAVRHGIAPLVAGGTIAIHSNRHNSHLQIVVKNSGTPPSGGAGHDNTAGNGIGLTNTAQRLKILYGDDHRFALEWTDGGVCEVTVEIPFRN